MAEPTTSAPATYRQPSRKGKRAWRKNVDLSEVQQGLEDVREEIIQGGIIAEKDSSELFATDLTGDADIAKQHKTKKLLRVDEILAQRSAVPGLDGRKRRAREEGLEPAAKKQKNGAFVPHKDLQRLRAVADNANGAVAVDGDAANRDLWDEPAPVVDPRFTFLEKKKQTREPKTLKHAPESLAANGKRIPHVRKPDGGKSYNPLVGDWSALLERKGADAVDAETKRLEAEAAAEAKEARLLEEAEKVEAAEKAEYATDYDSAWESEWDGFRSDNEEVFTQKAKSRKTQAQRNKIKARKEREALEKAERKDRERKAEERRIRHIAKELSEKDKARHAHAVALHKAGQDGEDSSASDTEDVVLQRRRFGKLPIPEAPLEVVLPDELEDSLRRLKPEGNLMEERYRNLLISGKLEVRKKQWQRKQPKVTTSEKWSYKDWKLR